MGKLNGDETELTITRVFDAPRERVWRAWTEPDQVMRWWGPAGYTSPSCRIDLRVGGAYLFCMRSPHGNDFWSTGTYREIVPLERLVCTDSFADEEGNVVPASYYGMEEDFPLELQLTVRFEPHGGKTAMMLRHAGFPPGPVVEMTEAGWNESFDKLAAVVRRHRKGDAKMTHHSHRGSATVFRLPSDREIVMERDFDAPRDLVFDAWSRPDLIPRWWGPRRYTTTVEEMDVRPGGRWRYVQYDADGSEHAFHGEYRDVQAPERVVYTFEYEGMPGHVILETATWEERDGKTKLTVNSQFDTVEERDGMLQADMQEGAGESQDRFAELLTELWLKLPC